MFGYILQFAEMGDIAPMASSMVKRVMSELARRIKHIAYGCIDKGVPEVVRTVLKRFTNAGECDDYWRK